MSSPKRPDNISKGAWRVMQQMRSGDSLSIHPEGTAFVGMSRAPMSAVDCLLSSGMVSKVVEYDFGTYFRLTDAAWDIAAGDSRVQPAADSWTCKCGAWNHRRNQCRRCKATSTGVNTHD